MLCLRVTEYCQNMVSQKKVAAGKVVVQLAKGEIQEKAARTVSYILQRLRYDPVVPVVPATVALLTTYGHCRMRFDIFRSFPSRLWEISFLWNPKGWLEACVIFLEILIEDLDVGYSLPLQRAAKAFASEMEQLAYLMSAEVQSDINKTLELIQATSLDVERKHNVDKKK